MKVYPNPTTGELTINSEQLTINNVEIFDISGRFLTPNPSPKWRGESDGLGEVVIDISHLPDGVYFLKIGNEMVRVVKQ